VRHSETGQETDDPDAAASEESVFDKLLIANRGEIAVRILRACRELGIRSAAVYSEADQDALHVRWADESCCIGAAPAAESYLNGNRIIETALRCGAQAIHPGYGFLSENADFAAACHRAGLVFVGPKPEAIRLMGDKAAARETMRRAGVPVLPGKHCPGNSEKDLLRAAREVGYPLLIKATYGGGGKGMRIVGDSKGLIQAWNTARAEAEAACGSGDIYLEAFVPSARHIEIQVLADEHGNVVHCGERECSVQRRHQKLVEEAPSPAVTPTIRRRLTALSVRAVRKVGYTSVGTMEFILDAKGRAFFIEMNTRIQVEHPVTEAVTGFDLVKEQIRVAAGERLRVRQDDIRPRGHAIECRVNAEDPDHDFVPSPGVVEELILPGGPGIRVDTHLFGGYAIPHYYDSLAAKIVVHADTRTEAIARMLRALDEFHLRGVSTNTRFLTDILKSEGFMAGAYSTDLVADLVARQQPRQRHHDLRNMARGLYAAWRHHADE
jgi:acetyl-CoA carboxylase biotin carboxylase subunit